MRLRRHARPVRSPRTPSATRATGELHAVAYYWEWDYVQYVVVGTDGRVRRTRRHPGARQADGARLRDHRVAGRGARPAGHVRPRSRDERRRRCPYRWNPDYGARVGLLPRDARRPTRRVWCERRALLRVPPAERVRPPRRPRRVRRRAAPEDVRRPTATARTRARRCLERWTIDPAAGTGRTRTMLDDRGQEFPRLDERLDRARAPLRLRRGVRRRAWSTAPALKHDLDAGTTEVHDFGAGPRHARAGVRAARRRRRRGRRLGHGVRLRRDDRREPTS